MIARLLDWLRGSWAWLRANPTSLLVVLGALGAGSLAGLPVAQKSYDYMWRDASFCDDCHVHDYANEAFAASVHARLTTCHDCHRVPIRHYPKNLFVAAFDRPETPEDIPNPEVQPVICEQCHSEKGGDEPLTGPMPESIRAQVVHVDQSPLHRLHLEAEDRTPSGYHGGKAPPAGAAEGPIVCTDCHGGEDAEVHRFPAESERCEACHEGIRPQDEAGDALSCLDCHERGFGGSNRDRHAAREVTPAGG